MGAFDQFQDEPEEHGRRPEETVGNKRRKSPRTDAPERADSGAARSVRQDRPGGDSDLPGRARQRAEDPMEDLEPAQDENEWT
jgi:hypothetical protein